MTTVLFVHGTGVRQPAYDVTLARVVGGLGRIRPRFTVERCYWGGDHGSWLRAGGASIPVRDSGRSALGADSVDADGAAALWELLDEDPLFELRLLMVVGQEQVELPPHAPAPAQLLAEAAGASASDIILADAGLSVVFQDAVEAVVSSDVYAEMRLAGVTIGILRPVLARALVAQSIQLAEAELGGRLPMDGRQRDEVLAVVVAGLGGSDRSISGSMGRLAAGLALRLGLTKPLERRRAVLTSAAAPVAGDVLAYVARGEPIREYIGRAVASVADPPVILLAHSLGGIASLELVVAAKQHCVEMLVTVGCQAPLLYELNALPVLEFGMQLPAWVPAWANVFDQRDLLGFAGAPVFPGRVIDHIVDNRVGFPRAHSAYFGNRDFYAALDEVLP